MVAPRVLDVVDVAGDCRLTLRTLEASGAASPTVLILPAMGTPARFYTPFVEALHAEGLTVVTTDLRGQGECVPRVSRETRFGYREMVEDDLPAIVAATHAARPGAPLYLLGHSLGGHLALMYAAHHRNELAIAGPAGRPALDFEAKAGAPVSTSSPRTNAAGPAIAGIVTVASGSVWYRSHGRVRGLGILAGTQLAVGVAAAAGYWPGGRIGFGGRQPTGVIRDWARQARTGRFSFAHSPAPGELSANLRRLETRLLAVSVGADGLSPTTAVDHLCSMVPAADVTRWHYDPAAAGGRPIDHFRWVRAPEPVARRIARWLANHPAP